MFCIPVGSLTTSCQTPTTLPSDGYIYLIEMDTQGVYKIGKTTNIRQRARQIGLQMPFPYRLVVSRYVDSVAVRERCLHKLWDRKRLNGEWFRLTEHDVRLIDAHLLTWQAEGLVGRLGLMLSELSHVADEPELTNVFQVLLKAKMRMCRRMSDYLTTEGNPVRLIGTDTVLDAEVIA